MRVAVASGKGGTGKTLISTSLTHLWSSNGYATTYVDADVEEPNGHLFLSPEIKMETRLRVLVPALAEERCAGHGKCQQICAFNAILSTAGGIIVFNELCHSCGACVLACPDHALIEKKREIGTIYVGTTGKADYVAGRLDVGEARVSPLIDAVVRLARSNDRLMLIDAPPGTSCSATTAARGADLLLLVTEPTPFGLHDLELAVGMGRALGIRLAAVINRADLGNQQVRQFLDRESIPVLAEIPFNSKIAQAYAEARLPFKDCRSFSRTMIELGDRLIAIREELP